jgi:peptidyl-prolyl cis-trans isomerase C
VAVLPARVRGGLALAALLWVAGTAPGLPSEAPPGQAGGESVDRVLVRVNGHAIRASELDRVLEARLPALTGHASISPERLAVHRRETLQELVVQRLELDEAHRVGLTVTDAEVDAAEAELKARFPDAAAYERAVAAQGLDPAAIRAGLAEHLLGRKMEDRVRAQVQEPTREQLMAYHAEHPEKFRIPPRADVTYVLAPVDPSASPDDWKKAQAKVAAVKARIAAGEPFDDVTAAARADPALKVVALGRIHEGQAEIAEIDKAAFALGADQVSDPVWTLYGYAVVHVGAREPGRQLAFDELNLDLFRREWREAREGEALQAWLKGLMASARLEFGDQAAAEGTAPAPAAVGGGG